MIVLRDNGHTQFRVQRITFRGSKRLDVRRYYLDDDGKWKPTRQGISVPIDEADEFIEAMREAVVGEVT